MVIQDVDSSLLVSLKLADCVAHFKHRSPTTEEVNSFKQYCLTQGDTPWNLSSFSDQFENIFINSSLIMNQRTV
jgi:hypothetical protein